MSSQILDLVEIHASRPQLAKDFTTINTIVSNVLIAWWLLPDDLETSRSQ